ncbi:RNA polymerase sigma factor [Flavobacterium sp. 7A]|uniref:RNA polymerase sigma factor n=1 Tax=Flavobacterium sp. 7A TaxID=2940571 RepID=UPI002227220A|nr:sigma-70 family RNA polymerase sigma factor [Flavobacterium sp. 7A]MCW2119407.1 RNA polymerase sigma factor (sigma-70 family) [Flavobacterium sp. 7A]
MQTNISYYQTKKEYRLLVSNTLPNLLQLKKTDDKQAFNALVLKIVPEIRKYINSQLNTAIKKGHFSKNKIKANDIIDQLFIEIYDYIDEVQHEDDFYHWLFKKTNELLDDIIVEEEFDGLFFKDIDEYSKPEWDEMQENFSTDGNGHLLMVDELDDLSYNHNDYTLNHVFIEDDEKSLIEKIDKDLSAEEIQNHISMVVYHMPYAMRNVFELFSIEELALKEIAQITNKTLEEVVELLQEAKKTLQESLLYRYSITQ